MPLPSTTQGDLTSTWLLKNQISILTKEKNTSDNKILKLTNELEGNNSELDYKSKFEELSLQFESLNDELVGLEFFTGTVISPMDVWEAKNNVKLNAMKKWNIFCKRSVVRIENTFCLLNFFKHVLYIYIYIIYSYKWVFKSFLIWDVNFRE